jgi:hypothetical protein
MALGEHHDPAFTAEFERRTETGNPAANDEKVRL